MKTAFFRICAVWAVLVLGVCQAWALDGVVIANESVPVSSLDAAGLKDIYSGKTMYWEGGEAIVIVVANDQTDTAIEQASGMNIKSFKTYWQRLSFSGRGQQPKRADNAAAAVALVASTRGAIAIVPKDTRLKGVKKLTLK